MKRCPECRRDYYDDTLLYCLDDGTALLEGPASVNEPATAILSEPGAVATGFSPAESPTRTFDGAPASDDTADRSNHQASTKNSIIAGVFGIFLVIALGVGSYIYYGRGSTNRIDSIAVMPFVNESGNADVEYLSDGMTETLISSLSQLSNLNVKPRSSVFRYKGKETNPQAIGKELNVQAILNGRVIQRGQDLSLFVELIDVALDKVIWSRQYNRKQSDVVSLQTEIARDISSKIKTKLSGGDEAKVAKTYTTNPEAYQLYLKGNYYRTKYTDEGYKKAVEHYQKAIEMDSNYALAYSGIAHVYLDLSTLYLSPNETFPKVKAAALKALELDDTLATPHLLLGAVAYWYEWDWAATERERIRAVELEPNNAVAHQSGTYLLTMGRFDEAISETELSRRLAPFDLQIHVSVAEVYHYAGRYDKAIEEARKTIEMDQNYWAAHLILGLAYERKGRFREAIAELQKAHSLENNPWTMGYLGYLYAAAGKRTEAYKVLDELQELSAQRYVSPYSIAMIYAGLNDKDQAFKWLDGAYETRSGGLAQLKVETVFDNLHSDPRYKEMLKRMNLPE